MGAEESTLNRCNFQNPIVGRFNLNSCKVYIIEEKEAARAACKILESKDALYIDCEGHNFGNSLSSKIAVVQIADSEDRCFLFHVLKCPDAFTYLKPILESTSIIKVFHDCSGDIAALYMRSNIAVNQPIIDTQLTQELADGNTYNLAALYERLLHCKFPNVKTKSKGTAENKWFMEGSLTEDLIKYAALDVLTLPLILQKQGLFEYDQIYKNNIEKKRLSKIPTEYRSSFLRANHRLVHESRSICERQTQAQSSGFDLSDLQTVIQVGTAVAQGISLINGISAACSSSSSEATRNTRTGSRSASRRQTQQQSSGIGFGTVVAAGAAIAGGILLMNEIAEANRRK